MFTELSYKEGETNVKYVNQKEYPDWLYVTRVDMEGENKEYGRTTTISSSGCGLCSAVMVADRLIPENEFGLKEAIRMSYDTKSNHSRGTDYERFAPAFAQKYGLELEMTNDGERLRYCLRSGGAGVVHVKGDREGYVGVFSHGGHYIAAICEERDGRIAILDPSYFKGKYEEEGRKGLVEMKNDVIALCDMQVLIDDSMPAPISFYLFWRK